MPTLPGLAGFRNDLHQVTVNGCDLRYLRTGTGAPVVLLHPLRAQLEYFLPLLRHLNPERFEVIALDLPGHGESGAPHADYTATYFTDAAGGFLETTGVRGAVLVGESIGGAIALALAARHDPHVARVVSLNPYDYGRRGGIRRSSPLANVLFTTMLWPAAGTLVAHSGTKALLRRVLAGGLHDPRKLPDDLVDEMYRCGSRPGHARAFRSLCLQWRSWISARDQYPSITIPATLAYGDHDWSRPPERAANQRAIPGAHTAVLEGCGHFSSLERPGDIAPLISQAG